MKKVTGFIMAAVLAVSLAFPVKAEEAGGEPSQLYAKSAVLMDGDSGRVLFDKNGNEAMPMASTTKIMTCIVTLENVDLEDIVTVSGYAASMPDVQMNARKGEQFYLKDLLHSLMLESHNDSAVAIAEHVAASFDGKDAGEAADRSTEESKKLVLQFAGLMNQKAKDIGCYDTFFVTPNGLDATASIQKEDGSKTQLKAHSTTASDLARIMSYCIKKSPCREQFLEITRAANYSFTNQEGSRSFSCTNHNAFLTMMDGALSGKTGFTSKAGYCYVGALERDGKTLVVALLACGWPNHKTYKWSDTRKLMNYGLENFEYHSFDELPIDEGKLKPLIVENGQTEKLGDKASVEIAVGGDKSQTPENGGLLLKQDEKIEVLYEIQDMITAPVQKGMQIGKITYSVNGEIWKVESVVTQSAVPEINFQWCLDRVIDLFIRF